ARQHCQGRQSPRPPGRRSSLCPPHPLLRGGDLVACSRCTSTMGLCRLGGRGASCPVSHGPRDPPSLADDAHPSNQQGSRAAPGTSMAGPRGWSSLPTATPPRPLPSTSHPCSHVRRVWDSYLPRALHTARQAQRDHHKRRDCPPGSYAPVGDTAGLSRRSRTNWFLTRRAGRPSQPLLQLARVASIFGPCRVLGRLALSREQNGCCLRRLSREHRGSTSFY